MIEATVYPLDRGRIRIDSNIAFEHDRLGTIDQPDAGTEMMDVAIYNLLIDHPEATILVDSGSHPEAGDGYWAPQLYQLFEHRDAAERTLETALGEKGFAVDDVDAVFQTHLHLDHAGGLYNFEGTDVPIYAHEAELRNAFYQGKVGKHPAYLVDDYDRDLNWHPIHLRETTPWEDVTLHHLPGHCPGLMGLSIDLERDGTLIFTSDQCIQKENYEGRPQGGVILDERSDWMESLQRLYELERTHDAIVYAGHDLSQFESFPDSWS
jgi:glyoxylase-like metal-dependent hydrolase (beta-lactamase superfamily II)